MKEQEWKLCREMCNVWSTSVVKQTQAECNTRPHTVETQAEEP